MKPPVPPVAALVAATTISMVAGSPPTGYSPFTPQIPAQPAPMVRVTRTVDFEVIKAF